MYVIACVALEIYIHIYYNRTDYVCIQNYLYLNRKHRINYGSASCVHAELGAREIMNVTPEEELAAKVAEVDFAVAMSALTILRYRTALSRTSSYKQYYVCLLSLIKKLVIQTEP